MAAAALLAALVPGGAETAAGGGVSARIASSYPFLGGWTVAAHDRGNATAVLYASGGGIFVVDVDTDPATPRLFAAPGVQNTLRLQTRSVGGMVHAIAPKTPAGLAAPVYVAAGHAGLFQLSAATYATEAHAEAGDAWAAATCGDGVVVVGTHADAGRPASVLGYEPGTLRLLWNVSAPGDVWSVACDAGGARAFVGGWCVGLAEYAVSPAGARLARRWEDGMMARDAVVSGGVLVVAASTRGVRAYDVSTSAPAAAAPPLLWSIPLGGYTDGVTPLHGGRGVAVTTSSSFSRQNQFFGACAKPASCDGVPPGGKGAGGLVALSGDMRSARVRLNLTGSFCQFGDHSAPDQTGVWRAVLQSSPRGELVVAACPQLAVARAEPGAFPLFDSQPGSVGMFGNAVDGAAVPPAGGVLYTTTEQGITTWDLSLPDPLASPTNYLEGYGGITVAATDTRLFCPVQGSGVSIYSIEGPDRLAPRHLGNIAKPPGIQRWRPYGPAVPLGGFGTAKGRDWLYLAAGTQTLAVFDVSAADPAAMPLLAAADVPGDLGPHPFIFGVAVEQREEAAWVYAAYAGNVTGATTGGGAGAAGLLVWRVDPPASAGAPPALHLAAQVVAVDAWAEAQPAYVTFDPATHRVYAAYSCAGLAMFDVAEPTAPKLAALLRFPGQMVFQAALAPPPYIYVGLPETEEHGTAAAARRGAGVAVVDATTPASFAAGPLGVLPVGLSAIFAYPLPDAPSRLIVADGIAGVYLLNISLPLARTFPSRR